ncbi:MAG TPA: TfoX/Sxy family protein [Terracidiphilus sp.]|jgi:TfoX N-terminal domain
MPRDKGLETQINDDLGGRKGITEKPMFGGLAWLLDGKLLLGARHLGMLARIGETNETWALKLPGISPMMMRERRMRGWVRASMDVCGDDALRRKLITAAIEFVQTLPQK